MAPSDDPIAEALALVEAYCASRVPAELGRPPWNLAFGPEWSTQRVAQLRLDAATGTWTLHAADRNGRSFRYHDIGVASDVMALLTEIENDPTGIFWG